ncbi:MAG: prolyl oligopeptidase family serine peptidase [Bacteroidota bacterium]
MTNSVQAQENPGYQLPPKAIADLIDAPPTPAATLSPSHQWMLLLDRPNLPSIEEVAQDELRLAGIRINPRKNGSSRAFYYNGIKVRRLSKAAAQAVAGLPEQPKIENISWSPDGSRSAFTITKSNGLELWMLNAETATAKKLSDAVINDAISGLPYRWMSDSKHILYKSVLPERGATPEPPNFPSGPTIQQNIGKSAPVRTYQDLLKNAFDESLFEYYTSSQLVMVNVESGQAKDFGPAGIIKGFSPSPDGNYIMVSTIQRPFSYIVPLNRFPFRVEIYDQEGKLVKKVADIPIAENIPKGFGAVRTGPRRFSWRADVPASLYWVEAQDGGDPKKEADIRDMQYSLAAPFDGSPQKGISFKLRYGGITWGNGNLAMASEWWWNNRQEITSSWQPDQPEKGKKVLFDRSWEDRYNNPGSFEVRINKYGRSVLLMDDDGKTLFLAGQGASPEGNRPFVDRFDIETKKSTRAWRSEAPYYEYPLTILDKKKGLIITRRESREEPPNYFLRNLNSGELQQITHFENPYESIKKVKKELIRYKRSDGVELTGTLYLPPNYDKERDGRLPVFMWAYPREFKSADAAGQVTDSPYEFPRIGWWSPMLWVMQGYAVLDDFSMPIIGEGEDEPNETFVEQLRSGAEAAVKKLDEMGIADTERLGVGGHSYGAFMTANLMAHTDIFSAGIARSGAYNRTLTPFGFQSEERTFWEAPETYFKMSPFMHADKIKEPLLLIHGEADNNSGTYPMQSERFYAALKGHGATVRLVMLPDESHGYRARESVMHMLWEMTNWLDKYVKNKEVQP